MEVFSSYNPLTLNAFPGRSIHERGGPPNEAITEISSLSSESADSFVPSSEGISDLNTIIAQNRALQQMKRTVGGPPQEMTYGDARVMYKDGTVTSDTSARALKRTIEKAKKNSIVSIVIRGHGSDKGTTLNGSEGPNGVDGIDVTRRPAGKGLPPVHSLMLTGNGIKATDFTKLLDGKIDTTAKGAGIFINACNVANPLPDEQNLVQVISEKFPEITVRGVHGTLNESQNRVTRTYTDTPAWGSDFVYYKNGKVINEPWFHPHTKFSEES